MKEQSKMESKQVECNFCPFADRKRGVVDGIGICLILERIGKPHKIRDWASTLNDCPLVETEESSAGAEQMLS
jgi:hypothetical protein